MIGKGVGLRQDADGEAALGARMRLSPEWALGIESRVRAELVETYVTEEDFGRPFELIAGPTLSYSAGPALVQLLAGYRAPRGPYPAGPAVIGSVGFRF